MKPHVIACVAGFFLLSTTVLSQTTATPEKIGVLYYVRGDTPTELQRVNGKKKTGLLITARSKLRLELPGKTSDVIIQDNKPTFVVLLPSGDITKLSLYVLSVSGNKREAVVGTGGSLFGESTAGAETLPLDSSKSGTDVYRIVPTRPLKAGEYALAFAGSSEFFCFTVR